MICFYHESDFDGICSAAIVLLKYPECKLIGVDYKAANDKHTFSALVAEVDEGEEVIMVDFSFPMWAMQELKRKAKFVWIDHHNSAIVEAKATAGFVDVSLNGKLCASKAACQLTWEYFHAHTNVPKAVQLIARYDIWDLDDEVLAMQYGLKSLAVSKDPNDIDFWTLLFSGLNLAGVLTKGRAILDYANEHNAKICGYGAFRFYWREFGCLHVLCVNAPNTNSSVFDSITNKDLYDILMVFAWSMPDAKWRVSIYTANKHIDCGALANRFGGGGHRKAAGFITDTLPFTSTEVLTIRYE